MEYVKMPELLSTEAAKVLAGNMEALRDILSPRESDGGCHNDDICCPKKVKFIVVACNVCIINVNAVAAEDKHGSKC